MPVSCHLTFSSYTRDTHPPGERAILAKLEGNFSARLNQLNANPPFVLRQINGAYLVETVPLKKFTLSLSFRRPGTRSRVPPSRRTKWISDHFAVLIKKLRVKTIASELNAINKYYIKYIIQNNRFICSFIVQKSAKREIEFQISKSCRMTYAFLWNDARVDETRIEGRAEGLNRITPSKT